VLQSRSNLNHPLDVPGDSETEQQPLTVEYNLRPSETTTASHLISEIIRNSLSPFHDSGINRNDASSELRVIPGPLPPYSTCLYPPKTRMTSSLTRPSTPLPLVIIEPISSLGSTEHGLFTPPLSPLTTLHRPLSYALARRTSAHSASSALGDGYYRPSAAPVGAAPHLGLTSIRTAASQMITQHPPLGSTTVVGTLQIPVDVHVGAFQDTR